MLEVSAAVITDGSKVLCFQKGKSNRDYLSYKFEFPGGKLEQGETPEAALIRELSEELSMHISENQIRRYADLIHDYGDFSVLVHYLFVFCNSPHYSLKEHVSAKWMPVNEMSGLDWVDADMEIAKRLEAEGIE